MSLLKGGSDRDCFCPGFLGACDNALYMEMVSRLNKYVHFVMILKAARILCILMLNKIKK